MRFNINRKLTVRNFLRVICVCYIEMYSILVRAPRNIHGQLQLMCFTQSLIHDNEACYTEMMLYGLITISNKREPSYLHMYNRLSLLRCHFSTGLKSPLMSRIERRYCLISTSYLAGLFDIFILLHIWQNYVCFGGFLPMRTLCDAYHKRFESH